MAQRCTLVLYLLFVYLSKVVNATECNSGAELTVADNEECTISSDLLVGGTLNVYGTITVTASNHVAIVAQNIIVHDGGKISADGVTTAGTGTGSVFGSGGRYFLCNDAFLYFFFNIYNNFNNDSS